MIQKSPHALCRQALALACGLSTSIAIANTFPPSTTATQATSNKQQATSIKSQKAPSRPYQIVATFTVGPDFVQKGQSQTVSISPPYSNYYTVGNAEQTVADAGGFLGLEHAFTPWLIAQLGVSGYADGGLNPTGDVWQLTEPRFDNLTYSYYVHHARVMLTGKVLSTLPTYNAFHPYFSWEVGAAFNRTNRYLETPLIPQSIPMTPFASHSQESFAYGVGVGVDYNLNDMVRLGIGYQFADLGSASLGVSPQQVNSTQSLSIAHLYANQLRFQLTFLA